MFCHFLYTETHDFNWKTESEHASHPKHENRVQNCDPSFPRVPIYAHTFLCSHSWANKSTNGFTMLNMTWRLRSKARNNTHPHIRDCGRMHFVHARDRKHHLWQGALQPSGVLVVIDEPWSFPSHGRGYAFGNSAPWRTWKVRGEQQDWRGLYVVWGEANATRDVVRGRVYTWDAESCLGWWTEQKKTGIIFIMVLDEALGHGKIDWDPFQSQLDPYLNSIIY